jgi:hypothetical protein
MQANGATFNADVSKWLESTALKLDAVARQTAQEMSLKVVQATPLDTGFLRGMWQPFVNQPTFASSYASPSGGEPSGGVSVADISVTANGMQAGDQFWLLNATVYAKRLEYGFVGTDSLGRTYNQAGRFFVRDTCKKWPQVVQQVTDDLGVKL